MSKETQPLEKAVWDKTPRAAQQLILQQQAEIEKLRALLNRNSSNSSVPPSSDSPQERQTRDKKKPSGKKRGGQPGHPKHERPLVPTEQADEVLPLKPDCCSACGEALQGDDPQPHRHQVIDLPPIQPHIIEYQLHQLTCTGCGAATRAELPAGVPSGQFGPNLVAFLTVAGGALRLSKRLLVTLLENLCGLKLATGTVVKLQQLGRRALEPAYEQLVAALAEQDRVNMDETTWSESGQRRAMWVAVAATFTVFHVAWTKGAEVAKRLLGVDFSGLLGSDRYAGYDWVDDQRRQFCWAHLLRNFTASIGASGVAREVGLAMVEAARLLLHQWHRYQRGEIQRATFLGHVRVIRDVTRQNLLAGAMSGHAKTAALCNHLWKHWDCLWTFTREADLAPTNNESERALRTAVIWRLLSFGAASERGNRYVEVILTVLATCRQQDRNPFVYVREACEAYFHQQPCPEILGK